MTSCWCTTAMPSSWPDPSLRISRENQIKQQIANRRVMYARAAYDITDALIVRMNTAFGAAPPAPPSTRTP